MRRVIIESPFAGDIENNLSYLRSAMRDCLLHRGEAPFASHALYTQPGVLSDADPQERARGIEAGFAWGAVAYHSAVYFDRGISPGMVLGIRRAIDALCCLDFRWFPRGIWQPSETVRRFDVAIVGVAEANRLFAEIQSTVNSRIDQAVLRVSPLSMESSGWEGEQ